MITNHELQRLIDALKPYEIHSCDEHYDFDVNGYHIYIFCAKDEEVIHVNKWS